MNYLRHIAILVAVVVVVNFGLYFIQKAENSEAHEKNEQLRVQLQTSEDRLAVGLKSLESKRSESDQQLAALEKEIEAGEKEYEEILKVAKLDKKTGKYMFKSTAKLQEAKELQAKLKGLIAKYNKAVDEQEKIIEAYNKDVESHNLLVKKAEEMPEIREFYLLPVPLGRGRR